MIVEGRGGNNQLNFYLIRTLYDKERGYNHKEFGSNCPRALSNIGTLELKRF